MHSNQPTAMMDNLRRLCIIRLIVVIAMLLAIILAYSLDMPLAYRPVGLALGVSITITGLSWLRTHTAWPLTNGEFLSQLVADIIGLGAVLYFSGGATNPFVSYFLVPLCIAAATLPWRLTWLVAVLCLCIYTLLLFFHIPLPVLAVHSHESSLINAHVLGMWANFSLSALLITVYVVGMAQALRDRDKQLSQLREDDLRDEQIMAVATLAAGTAHELGTPLTTMRILLDEVTTTYAHDATLTDDLAILSEQLDVCRTTLKKLVVTADHQRLGQPGTYQAHEYFRSLLDDWHIMHPQTVLEVQLANDLKHCSLHGDATLKQAFTNLLNNAREASPAGLTVAVNCDDHYVVLTIIDQGAGLSNELIAQLGRPFIVNSQQGLGIGLLLTHATLSRFGGDVTMYNRPQGGTETRARIPASRPLPRHD